MCGTWVLPDSSVEFTISLVDGTLLIRATDTSDGEQLTISDVKRIGNTLQFTSITPSTGWTVDQVVTPKGEDELVFKSTIVASWKRKIVDPGP